MSTRAFLLITVLFFGLGASTAAGAIAPVELGTLVGVRDMGPAPSSLRVRVAVVLKYHRDVELEMLTQAQADPASPLYHHFLSSSQFDGYFSPTPVEYARVASSLRQAGFTITHMFPNRTVVDATAPAPVAARYFSTDIHSVVTADGRRTYTNVRQGRIPSDINDLVLTVQGLDAVGRMRPAIAFAPNSGRHIAAPAISPDSAPIFGPDGGYGPRVFIRSYALPAYLGYTGTGRASAVATNA